MTNPYSLIPNNDDFIIRFVHINEPMMFENRQINGITIAYVRDEERVYFAATLCNRHDTYEKSIGRVYSSQLLRDNILHMNQIPAEHSVKSRALTGIIGIIDMKFILGILGPVLAVQTEGKLSPMDFRHAFLSHCLKAAIFSDE